MYKMMHYTIAVMSKVRFGQELRQKYGVKGWSDVVAKKIDNFDFDEQEKMKVKDLCNEYEFSLHGLDPITVTAYALCSKMKKNWLSSELDITPATLKKRLKNQNWKHIERKKISELDNIHFPKG